MAAYLLRPSQKRHGITTMVAYLMYLIEETPLAVLMPGNYAQLLEISNRSLTKQLPSFSVKLDCLANHAKQSESFPEAAKTNFVV